MEVDGSIPSRATLKMTEREQQERKITAENLPEIKAEVAKIREIKGREKETLRMAKWARDGAERIGAHEDVVDLIWEEYLVGKHMVMHARDEKRLWNLPLKVKGIAQGFLHMRHSANEGEAYIREHNVSSRQPRSGRFLGEVAMLQKDYGSAKEYFTKSVELFNKMDNWRDRVNALELSGFLAEATILSGEPERGVALARKTFLAYDTGDGERLKNEDYYTWAVWKSGCIIKAWHALLATGIPLNEGLKQGMQDVLIDVETVFEVPEGVVIWGDFTTRKNEIEAIKREL